MYIFRFKAGVSQRSQLCFLLFHDHKNSLLVKLCLVFLNVVYFHLYLMLQLNSESALWTRFVLFLCTNAFFSLFPVSHPSHVSWLTCMRAVFLCVCVCVCVCEARSPHDLSVPYFTTFDPDEQIQMHRSNSMGLLCKSVAEDQSDSC